MNNAFAIYRELSKQNMFPYKEFYCAIVEDLLGEQKIRKNKKLHLVKYIEKTPAATKRLRCRVCKNMTSWKCETCSERISVVALCIPDCFETHHLDIS